MEDNDNYFNFRVKSKHGNYTKYTGAFASIDAAFSFYNHWNEFFSETLGRSLVLFRGNQKVVM